jgi:hypothetical protein
LYSYDTVLIAVAAVYALKSLPYRPCWHSWLTAVCFAGALFYVAGDKLWLNYTGGLFAVRLQLAPAFLSVWMVLECATAVGWRRGAEPKLADGITAPSAPSTR